MAVKAIVLGAGKGTRMESDLAKVLFPVASRPMLLWVLDTMVDAGVTDTIVVVGHQADAVRAILPEGVGSALQAEQLGTGHACLIGVEALDFEPEDEIIVIPGDMPLVTGATVKSMLATHRATGAAATLLTAELDEPRAYGRVIRRDGMVAAIVEVKDASPEQLEINEISTSVYVFTAEHLPGELLQDPSILVDPEGRGGRAFSLIFDDAAMEVEKIPIPGLRPLRRCRRDRSPENLE